MVCCGWRSVFDVISWESLASATAACMAIKSIIFPEKAREYSFVGRARDCAVGQRPTTQHNVNLSVSARLNLTQRSLSLYHDQSDGDRTEQWGVNHCVLTPIGVLRACFRRSTYLLPTRG